jgi:hypothetical protein
MTVFARGGRALIVDAAALDARIDARLRTREDARGHGGAWR